MSFLQIRLKLGLLLLNVFLMVSGVVGSFGVHITAMGTQPTAVWRNIYYDGISLKEDAAWNKITQVNDSCFSFLNTISRGTDYAKVGLSGILYRHFQRPQNTLFDTSLIAVHAYDVGDTTKVVGCKGLYNVSVQGPFSIFTANLLDTSNISNIADVGVPLTSFTKNFPKVFMTSNTNEVIITGAKHDTITVNRLNLLTHSSELLCTFITENDVAIPPEYISLSNGDYIIYGYSSKSATLNSTTWYARHFDKSNNQRETIRFDNSYNSRFCLTADTSGYVVCCVDSVSSSYVLKLVRMSFDGKIVDSAYSCNDWSIAPAKIKTAHDGGFILIGAAAPRNTQGKPIKNIFMMDCFVAKLSNSLKVEWNDSFGYDSLYDVYLDVLELPNHKYLLAGMCQQAQFASQPTGKTLACLLDASQLTSVGYDKDHSYVLKDEERISVVVNNALTVGENVSKITVYNDLGVAVFAVDDLSVGAGRVDVSNLSSGAYNVMMVNIDGLPSWKRILVDHQTKK